MGSVDPPGEVDTTVLWHQVTGSIPRGRALAWLNELDARHGSAKVQAALAAEYGQDATLNTLLGRMESRLVGGGFQAARTPTPGGPDPYQRPLMSAKEAEARRIARLSPR